MSLRVTVTTQIAISSYAIYLFPPVIPMLLQNMIFELFLFRGFTGANVVDLNKSRQKTISTNYM